MITSSPQIERLWNDEFQHYVSISEKLLHSPEKDTPEFVAWLESLRISFLFPNLTDDERWRIWSMLMAGRAVQIGVKTLGNPQYKGKKGSTGVDGANRHSEDTLARSRKEFEQSGLRDKLSPLQARIVDDKILTIDFGNKTTLRVRPRDSL